MIATWLRFFYFDWCSVEANLVRVVKYSSGSNGLHRHHKLLALGDANQLMLVILAMKSRKITHTKIALAGCPTLFCSGVKTML